MCLEYRDERLATTKPESTVTGYKIYRITPSNPLHAPYLSNEYMRQVSPGQASYEVQGIWYAPARVISIGDKIESNRFVHNLTIEETKSALVEKGIHVFTGEQACFSCIDWSSKNQERILIVEVEGHPEDFVAKGVWETTDVETMVFMKVFVKRFMCITKHSSVKYFDGVEEEIIKLAETIAK